MPNKPFSKAAKALIDTYKVNILIPEIDRYTLKGTTLTLYTLDMESEKVFEFDLEDQVRTFEFSTLPNTPRAFFEILSNDENLFIATAPESLATQMLFDLQQNYLAKQAGRMLDRPVSTPGFKRVYTQSVGFHVKPNYFGFVVQDDGSKVIINFYPEAVAQVNVYNTLEGLRAFELVDDAGGAITFYMDSFMSTGVVEALRSVSRAHGDVFDIIEE